jgi:hypothetical protein
MKIKSMKGEEEMQELDVCKISIKEEGVDMTDNDSDEVPIEDVATDLSGNKPVEISGCKFIYKAIGFILFLVTCVGIAIAVCGARGMFNRTQGIALNSKSTSKLQNFKQTDSEQDSKEMPEQDPLKSAPDLEAMGTTSNAIIPSEMLKNLFSTDQVKNSFTADQVGSVTKGLTYFNAPLQLFKWGLKLNAFENKNSGLYYIAISIIIYFTAWNLGMSNWDTVQGYVKASETFIIRNGYFPSFPEMNLFEYLLYVPVAVQWILYSAYWVFVVRTTKTTLGKNATNLKTDLIHLFNPAKMGKKSKALVGTLCAGNVLTYFFGNPISMVTNISFLILFAFNGLFSQGSFSEGHFNFLANRLPYFFLLLRFFGAGTAGILFGAFYFGSRFIYKFINEKDQN